MSTYQTIISIPDEDKVELKEGQTVDDLVREMAIDTLSEFGFVDETTLTVVKPEGFTRPVAVFTAEVR